MSDPTTCPACGARNAPDAEWCGQCFARFDEAPTPKPAAETPAHQAMLEPDPITTAVEDGPTDGAQGTLFETGAQWTCVTCSARHDLEVEVCDVCGTTLFETYGAETETAPQVDESSAVTAALLPGYGHVRLGQPALGVPIGLLVVLSLAFGIVFLFASLAPAGILLALVGIGLWAVSVVDAYRFARREESMVLLRPRTVSVITVVLLLVILASLVLRFSQTAQT